MNPATRLARFRSRGRNRFAKPIPDAGPDRRSGFPATATRAFNTGSASPTWPGAKSRSTQGLCTTAATSIRARQTIGGLLGQLLESPGEVAASAGFPASQWAVRRTMRRQTERPDPGLAGRATRVILDEARIKSRWPEAEPDPEAGAEPVPGLRTSHVTSDGRRNRTGAVADGEPNPPRAHAEAILAAARRAGLATRKPRRSPTWA